MGQNQQTAKNKQNSGKKIENNKISEMGRKK